MGYVSVCIRVCSPRSSTRQLTGISLRARSLDVVNDKGEVVVAARRVHSG